MKQNPDMLITRVDKGNATVIIKKFVYIEKLESLFCDNKYYEKIVSNPLTSLERETNELVKWLNKIDFTATRQKLEPVLQKFKVILYLKIFKNSNLFFLNFLIICYFEPKKSSLDTKFKKFYMIISKRTYYL